MKDRCAIVGAVDEWLTRRRTFGRGDIGDLIERRRQDAVVCGRVQAERLDHAKSCDLAVEPNADVR